MFGALNVKSLTFACRLKKSYYRERAIGSDRLSSFVVSNASGRHSMDRRWPAALLLAAFVAGGFLAPLVHGVQHDLAETAANYPAHCDHSQHEARFEIVHQQLDVDSCVLCSRQVEKPTGSPTPESEKFDSPFSYGVGQTTIGNETDRVCHPARGPPLAG